MVAEKCGLDKVAVFEGYLAICSYSSITKGFIRLPVFIILEYSHESHLKLQNILFRRKNVCGK